MRSPKCDPAFGTILIKTKYILLNRHQAFKQTKVLQTFINYHEISTIQKISVTEFYFDYYNFKSYLRIVIFRKISEKNVILSPNQIQFNFINQVIKFRVELNVNFKTKQGKSKICPKYKSIKFNKYQSPLQVYLNVCNGEYFDFISDFKQ